MVGLGNPGDGYARNRHNIGFLVCDEIAARGGARFALHRGARRSSSRAETADVRLDGERLILVKPQSFMNDSGGPAAAVSSYYDVPADRCLAVHDELDLPYGAVRLKLGGGDNGHNGLRSLRRSWGTGEYYRLRFGIGRPPGRQDPADYVLRNFSADERQSLGLEIARAADAVLTLVIDGLEAAQNRFNG